MKATLHFDLSDGDERLDFDRAVHALEITLALGEFRRWLRDQRKHHHLAEEAQIFADDAWTVLHEALNTQGVAELVD